MKTRVMFKRCEYSPQISFGWWDSWSDVSIKPKGILSFKTEKEAIDWCVAHKADYKLKNHPQVITWESE